MVIKFQGIIDLDWLDFVSEKSELIGN